jgi:hypothetical protein
MWWIVLAGCGVSGEDCAALDVSTCGEEPACAVITGYPTQPVGDGVCADYGQSGEPLGCMDAESGCPAVMSFGYDPESPDAVYSFGGCVPEGWESWSDDWSECDGV